MTTKKLVGWREWVELPNLNVNAIKVKIDSGAKTCALHAYFIEPFEKNGENWIRFGLHPNQKDSETALTCEARVTDRRSVTDSGGHAEERYIIKTIVRMANIDHEVEVTLTNRDNMRFRMLLGRNFLKLNYLVDSGASYLQGKRAVTNQAGENLEDMEEL